LAPTPVADAGRIIAGAAKGMRLAAPGEGTRALSDRVKQTLFAVLEAEGVIGEGRAFLDLFAGSGAAGIEALSRGSERATFVEKDANAASVIEANLRRARLTGGTVIRADAAKWLAGEAETLGGPFGAVLLDPPYETALLMPALQRLGEAARDSLEPDAAVVAKHFWRDAPPAQIGVLERYRERRFGETMLSFYRRRQP